MPLPDDALTKENGMRRILFTAIMILIAPLAAHADDEDIFLYEAETVGNKIYVSEILAAEEIDWACFFGQVCGKTTEHTVTHNGSSVTFTLYSGSPWVKVKSVTGTVRTNGQKTVSAGQYLKMEDAALYVGHKNFYFAEGAMSGMPGKPIADAVPVMGRDVLASRHFASDLDWLDHNDYGRWNEYHGIYMVAPTGSQNWVTVAAKKDAFSGSLPTGVVGSMASYEGHVLGMANVHWRDENMQERYTHKGVVRGDFFLLARFEAEGLRLDAAAQMSRDGHSYNGGDWVRWADLKTYEDGSFSKGDSSDILNHGASPIKPGVREGGNDFDWGYPFEGAFFGPNHEEVAGTFSWTESSTNETVVAAFGAQKQ